MLTVLFMRLNISKIFIAKIFFILFLIMYMHTLNTIPLKMIVKLNICFFFTDKHREALENYIELWDEIKYQIETIHGDNPIEYGKDFMKARSESNDDLPLSKMLNIPVCIIIVKRVFQEDNNYYPQVLLYECLHKHED